MEAKKTGQRDWSSLLPEMLNLIAKNLTEISDFIRFRAVCKAWRFSTPITDLPSQLPWILGQHYYKSDMWCFSIPSNKIFTIHPPKSFNCFLGPSEGYIIAISFKTHQVSLLNPFNNHEIPLPDINFDKAPVLLGPWKTQIGERVVCHLDGYSSRKLDVWYLWKNSLRELNLDSGSVYDRYFYLNNMIFIVDIDTGVTKAMDMATGFLIYVIPPTEGYCTEEDQFMLEASGDILRVVRQPGRHFCSSERFDVYRLDTKGGSPCWVKVTSIGDQALFIDWRGALILRANDVARIKRNSIYFYVVTRGRNSHCEVKRMDIETGAVEHISCSLERPGHWFVPILHHL